MSKTSTARHAKRSAKPVAVTGLAAVFVAGLASTASAAVPTGVAQDLARLRVCESGNNYAINTGNGFYGAYQFDAGTWRGLGYSGLANQASPATQDEAATRLQSQRGWAPWPGCTAKLGLGQGDTSSDDDASAASDDSAVPADYAAPVRASRGGQRSAVVPTSAAGFDGRILTTADVDTDLASVRAWQARMSERGWDIAVDGQFGPQSSGVAARFAAEKGLTPAVPGTVDKAVYTGAWTIAIS